jgi:hypothetical protein
LKLSSTMLKSCKKSFLKKVRESRTLAQLPNNYNFFCEKILASFQHSQNKQQILRFYTNIKLFLKYLMVSLALFVKFKNNAHKTAKSKMRFFHKISGHETCNWHGNNPTQNIHEKVIW